MKRFRMDIEHIDHALSGRGGEATVVPREDEAGEWVPAATCAELLVALKLILLTHDATCQGEDCGIGGIDIARAAIAKTER